MKHTLHGFSTLELLIAFAVMTLSMTAVIMVAFGNQSNAIDTELAQRALYIAQQRLEEAGASLTADFDAVANELTASAYDATFETQLSITDISECAKRVQSEAFWNRDLRELSNSLSMIVGSPEISKALGGDCATEEVTGWESPEFFDNPDPIHSGSQAYDIDVVENNMGTFVFLASSKNGTHETVWVIDASDPDNPSTVGQFDTGQDVYALDAYTDGNTVYTFLATDDPVGQLQVVSVDFASYPGSNLTIARIATTALPGVAGSDPEGRAIAYYDKKIYIGTRRTAGNEFHVFDVTNPALPIHQGSVELNHSVNEIAIRDTDAYIAATAQTAQGCELIVLNVSNPSSISNPCTTSSTSGVRNFRAPGNFGGTTVETFGNRVYLGRQRSGSDHDFYILNAANLSSITSLGSRNLNLNSNTEVTGLKVSGSLAFLATSDTTPANGGGPFLIYDISDPASIVTRAICDVNFSEGSTGLDMHDNSVYISNTSNKALRIFYPANTCS